MNAALGPSQHSDHPCKTAKTEPAVDNYGISENRKSHRCMPAEDAYSATRENPFVDRDFEQGRVALCQTQRRHAGTVVGFRLTQCALSNRHMACLSCVRGTVACHLSMQHRAEALKTNVLKQFQLKRALTIS